MSLEGNQARKEIIGNYPTDGREITKAEEGHIHNVGCVPPRQNTLKSKNLCK
jgi:hypothetical protein